MAFGDLGGLRQAFAELRPDLFGRNAVVGCVTGRGIRRLGSRAFGRDDSRLGRHCHGGQIGRNIPGDAYLIDFLEQSFPPRR